MSASKEEYREFCRAERSIPVFSRDWWLDAVAGEDWDVAIVKRGDEIVATMPYFWQKRFGFVRITHPPLTQTLGPWLKPLDDDASGRVTYQHKLLRSLIDQLPPFDYFNQRWHYANTNWLPFYWSGFEQTTRYTYVLDDLTDLEKVFSRFSSKQRQHIRRAEEKNIRICFDIPAKAFYENRKMTLDQVKAKIRYSYDVFERAYESGYENNSACTIGAYDEDDNLHAAVFVVWDENSAYHLISTIDHNFRKSGASSLLLREEIRHAATKSKRFDFEGSMVEAIERHNRGFNSRQVPYFSISKSSSRLYSAAVFVKLLALGRERTL